MFSVVMNPKIKYRMATVKKGIRYPGDVSADEVLLAAMNPLLS